MIEQPPIILCRIIWRQLGGRGGIEHVVDNLSAVEDARFDHLTQRSGVADRRKSKETVLPARVLARVWHHLVEHLPDAERFSAAPMCRWKTSTRSSAIAPNCLRATLSRCRNVPEVLAPQPDLSAHHHVGRFELLRDRAEIFLRFSIAILHRSVEVVPIARATVRSWSRQSPRTISTPTAPQPKPRTESPGPKASCRCGQTPAFP